MRIRGIAVATAALLLLPACGSADNQPAPHPAPTSSTPNPLFPLGIAAEYTAEAKFGTNNTELIKVTVGNPVLASKQQELGKVLCTVMSQNDLFVPVYLQVINKSAPPAPAATIGAVLSIALDPKTIGQGFAVSLQNDDGDECRPQGPLKGMTMEKMIVDMPRTSITYWSQYPAQRDQELTGYMHLVLTGVTLPTPPLSAVFLRLNPTREYPGEVPYGITKLTAGKPKGDNNTTPVLAAVVTDGTERSSFYIPLDPTADPCDTFKGGTSATCGSVVKAPVT